MVKSFLSNRSFSVRGKDSSSTPRTMNAGTQQGSILSPTLFSLYMADIPTTNLVNNYSYADDTAFLASDHNVNFAGNRINHQLAKFHEWCIKWKTCICAAKSQAQIIKIVRGPVSDVSPGLKPHPKTADSLNSRRHRLRQAYFGGLPAAPCHPPARPRAFDPSSGCPSAPLVFVNRFLMPPLGINRSPKPLLHSTSTVTGCDRPTLAGVYTICAHK